MHYIGDRVLLVTQTLVSPPSSSEMKAISGCVSVTVTSSVVREGGERGRQRERAPSGNTVKCQEHIFSQYQLAVASPIHSYVSQTDSIFPVTKTTGSGWGKPSKISLSDLYVRRRYWK